MIKHPILLAAAILGAFTIGGTGLVSLVSYATEGQIAENERQALLRNIEALVPGNRYDNAILEDRVQLPVSKALGNDEPVTVYRARQTGQPVAVVFTVVAPDGYSGAIKLLLAIQSDESIAGVRALSHRETPGLGDTIERKRSDWIESFNGRTLMNPEPKQWGVKRDGGVFDQFTGATITPRAVVKAVRKALEYYHDHTSEFWTETKQETAS